MLACCLNCILAGTLLMCALESLVDLYLGKIYSVLMVVMWKVNSFIPALGASSCSLVFSECGHTPVAVFNTNSTNVVMFSAFSSVPY